MGNDKLVYLKPNVIFEPLVNRWYAWPYIISPGTAPFGRVHEKVSGVEPQA